jgi:hypothetical protein
MYHKVLGIQEEYTDAYLSELAGLGVKGLRPV